MNRLPIYYRTLLKRFGPQHWWPAETPFEVMVGAILTQNTNWSNVEKAIANLKTADLLDPTRLAAVDLPYLAQLIRPSGYFNVKARRLKAFVEWFVETAGGDVARLRKRKMDDLRAELLSLNGIGPETADSILLYACDMPTFVADAYTWRVFTRHNLVPEDAAYDQLKEYGEAHLPADRKTYNEFHALIVRVGKEFCHRANPLCDQCPLKRELPSTD